MDKIAQIQNQIIVSLKARDFERLAVLKVLLAKIKNKQIELKGQRKEFQDEDLSAIILGEIKSRKESIEAFRAGKREDLAQKEEKEISLLNEVAQAVSGS